MGLTVKNAVNAIYDGIDVLDLPRGTLVKAIRTNTFYVRSHHKDDNLLVSLLDGVALSKEHIMSTAQFEVIPAQKELQFVVN